MLDLGLTKAVYAEYVATVSRSHVSAVAVMLLDNDHKPISTVRNVLMDGQVDVTAPSRSGDDVEVSRTCMLTLLDPKHALALDSSSSADGALYLDRMIRVIYSVLCPSGWVNVPVFTGPIVKVDRDGAVVNVEAQGKERFALTTAWNSGTFRGYKTSVITQLLQRSGEVLARMNIPPTKSKTEVSITPESKVWVEAWKVSASLNRALFYDARGVLQCRPRADMVAVEFTEANIVSDPQISYSTDDLSNAVRVKGSKGSKSKKVPWAQKVAPSSHPLSPARMGRGGKSVYLGLFEDNPNYKSNAACLSRATSLLNASLEQATDATYEVIPRPDLEPWDLVQCTTSRVSIRTRPRSFTLPLVQRAGSGTPMTIGFRKDVRKPIRRIGKA